MIGRERNIDSRAVLRFVTACGISIALLIATYGAFVLSGSGQRLENLGLAGAELRSDADRLESLGNLSQISVLSFAGAVLLIVGVAVARRRAGLGLIIVLVTGTSVVAAEILKDVLPRPELFAAPAWQLRNTFPSGTATAAAALGVGCILVAPDRFRWIAVVLGAAYASTIGQATQIAGWHRLSGAIGGVFLVMAIASLALAVLADRGLLDRSREGRGHPGYVAGLLGIGGGIVLTAALIAILPVVFPLMQVPEGASSAFVHTSLDLIGVGVTTATFAAFGLILEPFSLAPTGKVPRPEIP